MRRRDRLAQRWAVPTAVAACMSSGCTSQAGDLGAPTAPTTPYNDQAQIRPELIEVPDGAAAGDVVEVSFPQGTRRGTAFVLEEETEGGWQLRYFLFRARPDLGRAPSHALPGEDVGWTDIAVEGPGPESLRLPPDLEGGDYRICTAGSGPMDMCARLEVHARS